MVLRGPLQCLRTRLRRFHETRFWQDRTAADRRTASVNPQSFGLWLLLALAAGPVLAQTRDDAELELIFVTASRLPQTDASALASTGVLTDEDLRRVGARHPAEVMGNVPGTWVSPRQWPRASDGAAIARPNWGGRVWGISRPGGRNSLSTRRLLQRQPVV